MLNKMKLMLDKVQVILVTMVVCTVQYTTPSYVRIIRAYRVTHYSEQTGNQGSTMVTSGHQLDINSTCQTFRRSNALH